MESGEVRTLPVGVRNRQTSVGNHWVSRCLFPLRLHATCLDFLTSSFNRAHPWVSVYSAEARQQQPFDRVSPLVQFLLISGSALLFPHQTSEMSQLSLKHSQRCLTVARMSSHLWGLGELWSLGRGTAVFRPTLTGQGSILSVHGTHCHTSRLLFSIPGGPAHSLSITCFKAAHLTDLLFMGRETQQL